MLELAINAFSPSLKFLHLAVYKILQFKINRFGLTFVSIVTESIWSYFWKVRLLNLLEK